MKFVFVAALVCTLAPSIAAADCGPVPHAANDYNALSRFWGTTVSLCRAPDGTGNAYADRDHGVVWADQAWLDGVASRYGNWAAVGILAHEWGHIVQGNVGSGTAAELQADCLAGVFLRGAGLPPESVREFAAVNWNEGGDPYWTPDGHGTSSQRVTAALRGYSGFQGQPPGALAALCPLSAF